eukprot:TRINITY_DN1439_c0_g1_i1.p1 TRINITY_DN1439_c0_g1~~TRINITY_DN1439_c0_g1_i1.p1  ORF type:complete len:435 (+),score=104.99 TRINITY_DN1439_c0_g1_i1:86-1390(+)
MEEEFADIADSLKEETKMDLNSSIDTSSMIYTESKASDKKKNDIIILSDSFKSSELSIPQPVVAETFVDKLAKWGTNFIYNAKVGNNIGCVLLGDKGIDESKPIQLLQTSFNLSTRKERDEFLESFKQTIWMTYRENFTPLLYKEFIMPGKDMKLFTTDNGWGCTIRAGQMALANGILRHFTHNLKRAATKEEYERIVRGFWDNGKGERHPFSIQNFFVEGAKYNKLPGEWLDQSIVAAILQKLNGMYKPYSIDVITFIDGAIYANEVKPKFEEFVIIEKDCSVVQKTISGKLLFVSLNLGSKAPEQEYLDPLKALFTFPELVGLMGGRKSEALFFVGWQNNSFLFLDPHLVQETAHECEGDETYHCGNPRLLEYGRMDVSCTAVLYVGEDGVEEFLKRAKKYSETHNALIKFYETAPSVSRFYDSASLIKSIV